MAAELVGTAYVRIRAITAGLAKEISDGVDKGVKDADIDKAGETLGSDLSEGAGKSFSDDFGDEVSKGVADAVDSPQVHKAGEKGGEGVSKDVTKGFERESKRHNPFDALGDRLKEIDLNRPLLPQIDGLRKSFSDAFDDIGVDIDFGGPRLEREAEESGHRTSRGLKKGFDDENKKHSPFDSFTKALQDLPFTSGPIAWAGIFGPTTLAPIIGTVVSLLGLVVEALGFIVTAAVGAGVALAGIAAVALPGFAVLFAAFKTQTKQLEKFKETAKKLLEPWKQIGIATQKTLLPGLEGALRQIQHLVPLFTEFGGRIGKIAADFAVFAAHTLTSEKNMRALGKILEASEAFFVNMRTAALALVDMLLPFLEAAAPLAVQFSDSIAKWATHLAEVVNLKAGSGELAAIFQTWYDRFVLLVTIIGNVFVGLWNILQIASTSATPFFDKIAEGAKTFADWTKSAEGKNKIKAFFDDIQPVLDEVWRLLGNLFRLIVAPAVQGDGGAVMFERLAGALGLLNDILENPITAKVLPYLLGLVVVFGLLSKAGQAAEGIKKFSDSMSTLNDVIRAIPAIPGQFMNFLTTGTFGALATPLLAVAAAAGLVYLAFKNWDKIVEVLQPVIDWFNNLATPLKIVVGFLGTLLLVLNPVAWAIAIAGILKNWDAVIQKLTDIANAIKEFVGFENLKEQFLNFAHAIPGALQAALDAIVEFFFNAKTAFVDFFTKTLPDIVAGIPDALAGLGDTIVSALGDIPGQLKQALLTGLENLPKLILDAIAGLFEVGQNLLGLIADGIAFALPRLIEFFVKLPVTILGLIGKVLPKMLEIGGQILEFLARGFVKFGPKVLFFFLRLPFEILTLLRKGLVELIKLGGEMIAALFRGLWDQKGRIFDFFKNLPGNILHAIGTALKWLFNLGLDIVAGLINGVSSNIGNVFQFFIDLPGKIIRFLQGAIPVLFDLGVELLQGILDGIVSLFGSFSEFFFGLPQKIVDFVVAGFQLLVDLGAQLPGKILEGIVVAAVALWDWFTALPSTILSTVTAVIGIVYSIGSSILGWIKDGIISVAQTLWDWFLALPQTIWDTLNSIVGEILNLGISLIGWILDGIKSVAQTVWDWFLALPGEILGFLTGISQQVLDIGIAVIGWILDGIKSVAQTVWDWFIALPGEILSTLTGVMQQVLDLGKTVIGWILDGIKLEAETLWQWIRDLPTNILNVLNTLKDTITGLGGTIAGWIVDGLKALPGMLKTAFVTAWNAAIDLLSFEWELPFPPHPTIGFDGSFLKLEMGGIVPGSPKGTAAVLGERNRTEAVIPMTRPGRALSVMQEAGLDKLVLSAAGGANGKAIPGETTMLHIDTAVMTSPVDVDMVVAKVNAAYNRLAS